jgi:hypothetical protein
MQPTHMRRKSGVKKPGVVSCRPLRQEHNWGRHYEYRVDESSNYVRPQWRRLIWQ